MTEHESGPWWAIYVSDAERFRAATGRQAREGELYRLTPGESLDEEERDRERGLARAPLARRPDGAKERWSERRRVFEPRHPVARALFYLRGGGA